MNKNINAIGIVRQMIADGQVSQEVAEKYFPELKESKDERIRKAILIYFDWLDGKVYRKKEKFITALANYQPNKEKNKE